jgi:flagellar hook assembly protein FlgD
VTIDILQSDGTTLVRNLAKDLARTAGTALKATWNGTNSANVNVAAGTYIYRIQATDASGKLSTATGNITVSSE